MPRIKSEQVVPTATKFQRSGTVAKRKPDPRGKVAIRIISVDERASDLMHKSGNRREDIVIEDSTVGDVYDAIQQSLFGSGQE